MKMDEDVKMISQTGPVALAKASEWLVAELTLLAWRSAQEKKRCTLQKIDLSIVCASNEIFTFLTQQAIVPLPHELKQPRLRNQPPQPPPNQTSTFLPNDGHILKICQPVRDDFI